jgi:hypothetical protein
MMGTAMPVDQPYDEAKFTELLLYVAQRIQDDPESGAVKLNKALWWSECACVRTYGRSISGAEYQKLEMGPAPRRLVPIRERLLASGDVRLVRGSYMGYSQDRLIVQGQPDFSRLSSEEKQLIDQVIGAIKGKNAAELSDASHQEMGWRMVAFYETIPFESAYLPKEVSVTPKMREHARELAARHGLVR